MLQVRGVSVFLSIRAAPVLHGIELEIAPGEILGIVGETGAGKTLLLRAICGALPQEALLQGKVILAGGQVAPVLQAPMAGLSPLRRAGAQVADAAGSGVRTPAALLGEMGLSPETARQFPQHLSGGMQMRVALARAMATGAGLILVDEPTAALDGPTAWLVLDALARLRSEGRAVLMVTHDPALAARICDRIAVLHDGRLVETGTAKQVLERPQHTYSRALMAALPSRAGRLADSAAVPDRPFVFEMRHAAFRHANGKGVHDIDLALSAGEVLAVCGASGSGKTTLARIAARIDPISGGSIRLDDAEIGAIAPARFSGDPRRADIQMVFQDPAASFPPWCALRQSFGAARTEDVDKACDNAGLEPALLSRLPQQLSQGQLARAALARATVRRPRVLILDEPTAALDAAVQAGVLQHLDRLRRNGMAMLLITHDLHIARILADRLVVIDDGRLVEAGPVTQVLSAPKHPTTQTLVAAMS